MEAIQEGGDDGDFCSTMSKVNEVAAKFGSCKQFFTDLLSGWREQLKQSQEQRKREEQQQQQQPQTQSAEELATAAAKEAETAEAASKRWSARVETFHTLVDVFLAAVRLVDGGCGVHTAGKAVVAAVETSAGAADVAAKVKTAWEEVNTLAGASLDELAELFGKLGVDGSDKKFTTIKWMKKVRLSTGCVCE